MARNTWVRLMLDFETSISLLNKWLKLIHSQILSLRKLPITLMLSLFLIDSVDGGDLGWRSSVSLVMVSVLLSA
jgi:hypothetical protein